VREDRKASIRCWECGERGHTKRDCKKWPEEGTGDRPSGPAAGTSTSGTSSTCKTSESCAAKSVADGTVPYSMHLKSVHAVEAVVALNIFEYKDTVGQSEEWLIDSGASVHIVNDYTLLQNPTVYSEPRPLQLTTEGV
jgi:hypothetical protein